MRRKDLMSVITTEDASVITPEEYEHLSFFLETTTETIKKITVCMQQLDMEVLRLKYELKAAINEHANFRHKLDEFESHTKKTPKN
ncbi:MAG: hypothetical protein WCG05_02270 [Alphaproteobacteria bacterium]